MTFHPSQGHENSVTLGSGRPAHLRARGPAGEPAWYHQASSGVVREWGSPENAGAHEGQDAEPSRDPAAACGSGLSGRHTLLLPPALTPPGNVRSGCKSAGVVQRLRTPPLACLAGAVLPAVLPPADQCLRNCQPDVLYLMFSGFPRAMTEGERTSWRRLGWATRTPGAR